MGYFGSDGQFGGWLQNPQTGGDMFRGRLSPMWHTMGDRRGSSGEGPAEGPAGSSGEYYPLRNDYRMSPLRSGAMGERRYYTTGGPDDANRGGRKAAPDVEGFKDLLGEMGYNIEGEGMEPGEGNVPDEWEPWGAWDPETADVPESKVNPMSVIEAAKPKVLEEMNRQIARSAMQQGKTGALMSSGLSKEYGKAARKAANDITSKTMDTLFQAAENQASREHEAQQAGYDRSFKDWGRRGDRSLESWGKHGDWEADADRNWLNMLPNLWNMLGDFSANYSESWG